MKRWTFEQDVAGQNVIRHNALPRFRAHWISGAGQDVAPEEPAWSSAGSDAGDDAIHFLRIDWIDAPPDSKRMKKLMQATAEAIDEWIAARL